MPLLLPCGVTAQGKGRASPTAVTDGAARSNCAPGLEQK